MPVVGQRKIKRSLKTPDLEKTRSRTLITVAKIKQKLAAMVFLLHWRPYQRGFAAAKTRRRSKEAAMRQFLYKHVDTTAWDRKGLSPFNFAICVLIIVSVLRAVIETERPIREAYPYVFVISERILFALFVVEHGSPRCL